MLKRSLVTVNAGWVSSLLLMACSGSYVKDVGDIDGAPGHGGSSSMSHGGSAPSPEEAGAGGVVVAPQAGQGGGPVSHQGGASPTEQGGAGGEPVTPDAPCTSCIIDELGPADTVWFTDKHASVSANVLDVTSSRVLQRIDAMLQIPKRTSAAWVVYEATNGQYDLRLDVPIKLQPGDGIYSSGPIEVTLEAGHRYAIGIYLDVGACYGTDTPETRELSFATIAGSSFSGGGDYRDSTSLVAIFGEQFAMRLYTTTPGMAPFSCPTELAALQALSGEPCAAEGQQCLDSGPACAHNYSVECTDGVWQRLTGLPAPCP